jgi:hypothetical protein
MGLEDGSAAELASVARLDTCVTLVDAGNLMANFGSLQSLAQREPGRVDEEDDRNVADLLLDQIEFADVILLNKVLFSWVLPPRSLPCCHQVAPAACMHACSLAVLVRLHMPYMLLAWHVTLSLSRRKLWTHGGVEHKQFLLLCRRIWCRSGRWAGSQRCCAR